MKKKTRKTKKKAEITKEELEKNLKKAGFFIVVDGGKPVSVSPQKDLHSDETIIYPEGSTKGIVVK